MSETNTVELALTKERLEVLKEHLEMVQKAGWKLGIGLIEQGEVALGRNIIARVYRHDNSKFYGIEFDNLNGKHESDDMLKLAVHQHATSNEHHPEYHGGIENMSREDLGEMVCDWVARSSHFCTNLVEWIEEKATEKYGFTKHQKVYKTIMGFVNIILDKPFKTIAPKKD